MLRFVLDVQMSCLEKSKQLWMLAELFFKFFFLVIFFCFITQSCKFPLRGIDRL